MYSMLLMPFLTYDLHLLSLKNGTLKSLQRYQNVKNAISSFINDNKSEKLQKFLDLSLLCCITECQNSGSLISTLERKKFRCEIWWSFFPKQICFIYKPAGNITLMLKKWHMVMRKLSNGHILCCGTKQNELGLIGWEVLWTDTNHYLPEKYQPS